MKLQASKLSFFVLTGLCCLFAGCENRAPIVKGSNISILDESRADLEFKMAFKNFFKALQTKDWITTYEMRYASFKQLVTKEKYLSSMNVEGANWNLDYYEILDLSRFTNPSGETKIRLIMKFVENGNTSYNVVWWKKEGGTWHCEEAGPSSLSLFPQMVFEEN